MLLSEFEQAKISCLLVRLLFPTMMEKVNDNSHVRSSQDQNDQCVFLPVGLRGHAHREEVQKKETSQQQPKHMRIIAGDFNAQLGLGMDSERDYGGEHTMGQFPHKRDPDEAVVDDTEPCGTEYTIHKDQKTRRLQISKQERETADHVVIDRRNRGYCTDAEASNTTWELTTDR